MRGQNKNPRAVRVWPQQIADSTSDEVKPQRYIGAGQQGGGVAGRGALGPSACPLA
jgi:hypothetical protein